MAAGGVGAKLARNGLRYRWLRLLGRPGKPQAVSLEVTHRCVCRCLMCNIWRIPESELDLPLAVWTQLLSSDLLGDLRELDITGGEPYPAGRPGRTGAVGCGLKHTHLKRLRSVAITTNGVLSDRVLAMTVEMLEAMRESDLELVVVCALDAVGELHDQIRRRQGAWEHVDRTVAGLVELRNHHPHLIVGLKTTVLPRNLGELRKIANYARERDCSPSSRLPSSRPDVT